MDFKKKIDWAQKWKRDFINSSLGKIKSSEENIKFWNERATWFDKITKGDSREVKHLLKKVEISKDFSVLDIGGGTGRFALPLARIARHVTVIEPSVGMARVLKENMSLFKIQNITLINKKWEDVNLGADIEQHDVVIAPYSLSVPDMHDAIMKINDAAKFFACLMTWVKRTYWDLDYLWPLVHGAPFVKRPDYIYIVNMLHDEGIYANVEVFRQEKDKIFDSMDEILEDLKSQLNIKDDSKDDLLKAHIKSVTRFKERKVLLHGISTKIWIYWFKN
ncbi:MAG: rRNA adenine N-6-methyltransferase family protein [Promethearchaeota archaeon]